MSWVRLAPNKYVAWDDEKMEPKTFIMSRDHVIEAMRQTYLSETEKALEANGMYPNAPVMSKLREATAISHSQGSIMLLDKFADEILRNILSANRAGHLNSCLDLDGLLKYYKDPREEDEDDNLSDG